MNAYTAIVDQTRGRQARMYLNDAARTLELLDTDEAKLALEHIDAAIAALDKRFQKEA